MKTFTGESDTVFLGVGVVIYTNNQRGASAIYLSNGTSMTKVASVGQDNHLATITNTGWGTFKFESPNVGDEIRLFMFTSRP